RGSSRESRRDYPIPNESPGRGWKRKGGRKRLASSKRGSTVPDKRRHGPTGPCHGFLLGEDRTKLENWLELPSFSMAITASCFARATAKMKSVYFASAGPSPPTARTAGGAEMTRWVWRWELPGRVR